MGLHQVWCTCTIKIIYSHLHLSANIRRIRCQVSLILGEAAAGRAQDLTHKVNEWVIWCYTWQILPFSYSPFPLFFPSFLILGRHNLCQVNSAASNATCGRYRWYIKYSDDGIPHFCSVESAIYSFSQNSSKEPLNTHFFQNAESYLSTNSRWMMLTNLPVALQYEGSLHWKTCSQLSEWALDFWSFALWPLITLTLELPHSHS